MKTFLRWVARVCVVLALLAACGYLAQGLSGMAKVAKAKKRAAADLAAALPASKQQAVRDRDRVRAAVAAWGRPAYAWQELQCDLDSVDAGWIVQDYTQECRIRSVDLIPSTRAPGNRCQWSSIPPLSTTPGPGNEPLYGAAARIGPSSAFDEERPYRFGCPDGIVGPPKYGASRLLNGSRPTSLDESPAWIVVTVDTDVSTTTLGCDPWALLFCDEPVDEPVLEVS